MKNLIALTMMCFYAGGVVESLEQKLIETLVLDIVSYEDFIQEDEETLSVLRRALLEKGIVGIQGIPGYKEKVLAFIEMARKFSALPEDVKESYAPNHALGETFLGYERGKERFKGADGKWVVDDLKVSYYGWVPENNANKWPVEVNLRTPFQNLGMLMSEMGESLMKKVGILGPATGICLDGIPRVGRMLYYRKSQEGIADNPLWCGVHCDHCLFTALIPAFYFSSGEAVPEPIEAGLFVRTPKDGVFKKVCANNPDVMLFQVGEFAQLLTEDKMVATQHRVDKALDAVERYTMALFFDAPMDATIHSFSQLARDPRYGGLPGEACTYRQWDKATFNLFLVKNDDKVK